MTLTFKSDQLRAVSEGRVVLVTGAGSGIGLAICKLFAEHGATVIMVDLDASALAKAAVSVKGRVHTHVCDVSSWSEQLALFDKVEKNVGRVDIICCNAGIDPELENTFQPQHEATNRVGTNWLAEDQHEGRLKAPSSRIWDVNVNGVMYGVKLAFHTMRKQNAGKIIITGSAASYAGFPGQDLYAASKHALLGLVRSTSQRRELIEQGISISMVSPWLTMTPLVADITSRLEQNVLASTPEDVARAVGCIAVGQPAEVNGKCIWIQGSHLQEVEDLYQEWHRALTRG